MQMVFYTAKSSALRKMGNQVVNVVSSDNSASTTRAAAGKTKLPRKVINGWELE